MTSKYQLLHDDILENCVKKRVDSCDISIDCERKIISCSENLSITKKNGIILNYELPNNYELFLKSINPMDMPEFISCLSVSDSQNKTSDKEIELDFRFCLADGETVTLLLSGRIAAKNENTVFQGKLSQLSSKEQVLDLQKDHHDLLEASHGVYNLYQMPRQRIADSITVHLNNQSNLKKEYPKGFLLLAGIDRFSLYNHAYGASFVDSLLENLNYRMEQILHGFDVDIFHLQGDQYAFLFKDNEGHELDYIARHFLEKINKITIDTLKGTMRLNFSMGGVSFNKKERSSADYIVKAESALSRSKFLGRGRFSSYNETNSDSAIDSRKLLKSAGGFIQAFEEDRFKLAFQPVMSSSDNKVNFYECLLRIIDGDNKLISAGSFIEKIEEFGLIHIADQFALKQAVFELSQHDTLELSVNVSNSSINNPTWLRTAISLLKFKPEIACRLVIEITETTIMTDIQQSKRIINSLRDLGCKIALDDFGAGFTSFHQIKELRPDILKIDRSFSEDLHLPENQVFIDAIQMLATGLSVDTVAEGAETMLDVDQLKLRGIENIQGFVFGHPTIKKTWL